VVAVHAVAPLASDVRVDVLRDVWRKVRALRRNVIERLLAHNVVHRMVAVDAVRHRAEETVAIAQHRHQLQAARRCHPRRKCLDRLSGRADGDLVFVRRSRRRTRSPQGYCRR